MRSGSLAVALLALVVVTIAAGVCLLFPLTANPGPESAQVLGIVGGVALCLVQAARASRRRQEGFAADLVGGVLLGAAMLAIFLVATGAAGAVRPSCGAGRGFLPFVFLSVPVLALHAVVGTWVGRTIGKTGPALAVALAVELAAAVVLFVSWYRAPGFLLTSHFFVVVAGDLLRGAAMPPVVVGYRAATLLFALALVFLGAARHPRIRRSGLSTQTMSNLSLYALALTAGVLGGVAHAMSSDAIAPDHEELVRRYSLVKQRGPLVVHADPVATSPREVDALLAEGSLWLDRIALRLGQRPLADIHVWLHASDAVKGAWTGAHHVDFALPWRHEIHVAGAQLPHPSLGHELAHVVAGELTDSPLRIPSDLVFFYRAAVVEGLAVALTPELSVRDGLTVKELAAAMRRAGFAPPTTSLFAGISFFAEAPSRAYVAAGAFVESLAARALPDPRAALAALYRRGRIEDAVGGPAAVAELAAAHDALLATLPLPPDAALVATTLFARPSILREVCSHGDAERVRALRAQVRTGDGVAALASIGPRPSRATLEDLLADALTINDTSAALALARQVVALGGNVDAPARTDALGDVLWRSGQWREAHAAWERTELARLPVHAQRALLAKRTLADALIRRAGRAPVAAAALDALLVAEGPARADAFARLHHGLGAHDESPADLRREPHAGVTMGRYLHARRLVQVGALEDGAREFRRLLEDHALHPLLVEQARLGLATALAKLGHVEDATALFVQGADDADRAASRLIFRDRAERASRAAQAPPRPERITGKSDPAWADALLLGAEESGPF